MNWTHNPPTEPGWYWQRTYLSEHEWHKPKAVFVQERDGQLFDTSWSPPVNPLDTSGFIQWWPQKIEMPEENDQFKDMIDRNIKAISESEVFVSLYSPEMTNFRNDPRPSIQLAIAILLDKPIIVGCLPGREVPRKLAMIADKVVTGTAEEIGTAAARFAEQWQEPGELDA